MLSRFTGHRVRQHVADERQWLARLQRTLDRFDVSADDKSALERSVAQLDRLFLLVVIGEFNAGKSAFINALVGSPVLQEGVTPTTTRLQLLQYGKTPERIVDQSGADVVYAPVPLLEDLIIVDTPGTNAIFREHERLTTEFVPQADLVLALTSADRPFTESERAFLEELRGWGKKLVLVINKIDLLDTAEDREQVRQFVTENARALLGTEPEVFPISARHALRRKMDEGRDTRPALTAETVPGDCFADLERYIGQTLDQRERLRLKLLNPIGIASRLIRKTRDVITTRAAVLQQDLQTIDDIERQSAVYRADISRQFDARLAEIDNILQQFENRGVAFFDETLRIGRIPDLLNKARIQHAFERQVVADVPQRIERQVQDVIDWMVASQIRQWQIVTDHVNRRVRAHDERLIGGATGGFQYDRQKLIDTVGRAANEALDSYDRTREAAAMADSVRNAVAGAALAQVGAVSLGAAVATLATTTAADVAGIVAAGTIAVLGMFVIPSKRAHAKSQLRTRIETMRAELMTNLRAQFEREVDKSVRGVMDAVAPYTRFVRAEHEKLTSLEQEIAAIGAALSRIRIELER
jgi:small GTP-binding protein